MRMLIPCTCIVCGDPFRTKRNFGLYCSDAHRQQNYRNRAYTPAHAHVHRSRNIPPKKPRTSPDTQAPERRPNKPPAKGKK